MEKEKPPELTDGLIREMKCKIILIESFSCLIHNH
jgi:hypothetical protein